MSNSSFESEGASRKAAFDSFRNAPFSPRARAKRLYRARRGRLLEVPVAALRRRFGDANIVVDEVEARYARVLDQDRTIEVGFAGVFRMFGALIDTQWVGVVGSVTESDTRMTYRFDKKGFVVRRGQATEATNRLGDETTVRLAGRSELKNIEVVDGPAGRRVVITPAPGTITAVYFPPMPPYSVPIRPDEADDHIALLLHLLGS